MFLSVVIIPIYLLAILAMFYMDSFSKALLFLGYLLSATFVLFLFISYPFPSAVSICCFMGMFAVKLKV